MQARRASEGIRLTEAETGRGSVGSRVSPGIPSSCRSERPFVTHIGTMTKLGQSRFLTDVESTSGRGGARSACLRHILAA